MPVSYSEEIKNQALVMEAALGASATAERMNISAQSIRNWKKKMNSQQNKEPKKFSPEFKELAVERAAVFGNAETAKMMGVSTDSVRSWVMLKKTYGSASAKDPRERHGKSKAAERMQEKQSMIISSYDWAYAIYEIYAKEPSEDGFYQFKERLDKYVEAVAAERADR